MSAVPSTAMTGTVAQHAGERKLCTFYIDDHHFAVDVNQVVELIPAQAARPVPQAPPEICGLINLRGQIIAAFDLRTVLGFPPQGDEKTSVSVLTTVDSEVVSLLVDRIGEIVELEAGCCELPPQCISAHVSRMLDAVYRREDQLLLMLNTDRLVSFEPGADNATGSE